MNITEVKAKIPERRAMLTAFLKNAPLTFWYYFNPAAFASIILRDHTPKSYDELEYLIGVIERIKKEAIIADTEYHDRAAFSIHAIMKIKKIIEEAEDD